METPTGEREEVQGQLPRKNVKRFRGELVFKSNRFVYHSTLGWRVTQKKKQKKKKSKTKHWPCLSRVSLEKPPDLDPFFGDLTRAKSAKELKGHLETSVL